MTNKILNNFLGLAIILLLITACSKKSNVFTDNKGNEFTTEKVYGSVNGIKDSSLNYAIVFPKKYDSKEPLPILFLLDPNADGSLPVRKYVDLANKYNYILVGSNVSRNGLSSAILQQHISSLINETSTRFKVDKKRMFIGGFSGGAKLAIMFASKMPELIGAIACGGSMPSQNSSEPNYYYAGIVGNKDFNYLETRQSFGIYDQYGFDYTAVVFDGNHEWPPVESFEMGLIGFEIYSKKIKRKELSEKWLEDLKQQLIDNSNTFAEQGKIINQYEILQQANRWFYGILSVVEIQKSINAITQARDFHQQVKQRQQLVKQEVKLRMEFIKAIESRDFIWWQTEVDKIKKTDQKLTESYLVKQRLLNYISMASFMLIKNDLNDEKLDSALDKIKVYELVDPTNADVYLMYAKYYLLANNKDEMQLSLAKAREMGFNQNLYSNDIFWKDLFEAELN